MNYHSLSKYFLEVVLLLSMTGLIDPPLVIGQDVGEQAYAFTLPAASGETISLAQYQGQYVVLEWMNLRCREVDRLYKNNDLPRLQSQLKEKGVVWLSVISEAEGKRGQVPLDRLSRQLEKRGGNQDDVLIDVTGEVGYAFGALKAPHLVLINPAGLVIYQGALDNQPTGESVDGPAINYVVAALDQSMNGDEVQYATTEAYGCPIRYDR